MWKSLKKSPAHKVFLGFILWVVTSSAFATVQLTVEEKQWIHDHPKVIFGSDQGWPPISFTDTQGHYAGISADIIKSINQKTGLNIQVKVEEWSSLLEEAKQGKIDGIAAIKATPLRQKYLNFTAPYATMPLVIVSKNTVNFSGIEDLDSKTVAVKKGSYLDHYLPKHYPYMLIYSAKTNEDAIEAVAVGNANAYIGNLAVANYLIKNRFLTNLHIVAKLPKDMDVPLSIGVSKSEPILLSIIQKALDDLTPKEKNKLLINWFAKSKVIDLTEDEQLWIRQHPVIKVAGETDWAPFDFVDINQNYQGIANEYLKLIAQKTGLTFKIETHSWEKNLSLLKDNKVDLLPAANKTKSREGFARFSKPYFKTLNFFFIRNDLNVNTTADLAGKTLAIPKNYATVDFLKAKYPNIKLLETNTLDDAIDAVVTNKAQILYDTYAVLSYKLAQDGISSITPFASTRNDPEYLYFMINRQQPELAAIINKVISSVTPFEKKQIHDKWLTQPQAKNDALASSSIYFSPAEKTWLSQHSTISFTGDPNWLPYEAFNADGKYIGIVADHLHAIEKKIPLKIVPQPVKSWEETLSLSKKRAIDVISGDIDDATLAENYNPITPYIKSPIVIVMNDKTDFIDNLNDLKGRKIVIIKGYGYTHSLHKDFPNLDFVEVNSADAALEGVAIGKYDAAVMSLPKASYLIKQKGLSTLKIVGKTPIVMRVTLFVKKGEPTLHDILDKVMTKVSSESGNDILNNWTQIEFASRIDYWLIFKVIIGFLVLLAITLYWTMKLSREVHRRKVVEDHLQAEKENFQNLFETAADAHLIIQNKVFISCNQAALDLLEINTKEELIGSSPSKCSPEFQPDGLSSVEKEAMLIRECFNRGTLRFDWVHQTQSGHQFWVDVVLTVIQYQGHPAIYVSWRDQTEQKALEASIKQNQAQVQAIIDSVPLIIKVNDYKWNLLSANQKAKKDYLIDVDNPNTKRVGDYYTRPEEQKEIEELLNTYGKIEQRIVPMKDINGNDVQMMLSILPIHYANQLALLSIYVDLSDRIHMEHQLNEAKELAESANQAKTEFLANMSHEIRTPMNAIIGFTELLNDQIKEPRLKSFIRTIQSAGNTLLMLINDILDLSKIEAGKMTLHMQPTNPSDLFQEIADIFTMNVQQKGLDLFLDVFPNLPEAILLDSVRLRQVLFNLLGNAVKFTESGYIKLSVKPMNHDEIRSKVDLLIEVEDTGIGIPEKEQARIFNVFEQQEGQDNRKFGGTGLGLSITKRLIEMMEGEIQVFSETGKGSTFKILLHQMDIASTHSADYQANHRHLNNIHFHSGKILVVDDINDNRELIAQNFLDTEVQVSQAENGQEAVDKALSEAFDLILMDIRMPVMDGYEAAQRIKAEKPALPIIALTASVMQDEFEKAKRAHFDGYLRKPVLKHDLFSTLCQYLPYDEIETVHNESKQPLVLSDNARSRLTELKTAIEDTLDPHHKRAVKTNNLEDFEAFSEVAKDAGESFDIEELVQFAANLKEKVDSFDIGGMQQMLKQYELLSAELTALIEKTTASRTRH